MPGALSKILDLLQRPNYAVAGATEAALLGENPLTAGLEGLKGYRTTFSDVLDTAGMDPGWGRTGLGLGLDIATDPLNLIPVGWAGRALGKVPLLREAGAALKATRPIQALGKYAIPYFDLPEAYVKERRLLDAEKQFLRGQAGADAAARFEGLRKADRQALTWALDMPGGLPADLKPELAARIRNEFGFQDTLSPDAQARLAASRSGLNAMAEAEMAAGVLKTKRPDYITRIYETTFGRPLYEPRRMAPTELVGTSRFAKRRSFDTLLESIGAGAKPEVDIAKIWAIRKYAGEQAMATNRFLERLVQNPALARPLADAPADWARITIPSPYKALNETAFDPKVADDLNKLLERKGPGDEVAGMLQRPLNWWKTVATVWRPGFHARNQVSNVYNAWLGGMDLARAPQRYSQANRLIKGQDIGQLGAFSSDQIRNAMERYGVTGFEFGTQGSVGDEVARQLDWALETSTTKKALARANPFSPNFWLTNEGRKLGSFVEDRGRAALYLDEVAKGRSLEDAALNATKWLINYREKSPLDRTMSQIMPFWMWTSRNLPLQVESLINTPWKPAALAKTLGAVQDQAGGALPEDMVPEWLQRQGAIRVPLRTTTGSDVLFSQPLPPQDFANLPGSLDREELIDTLRRYGAMTHPALKAIMELGGNRDLFRNAPVFNEQNPAMPTSAPTIVRALVQAGVDPELLGAMTVEKARGGQDVVMNPFVGYALKQIPILESIGKAATPSTVDPETFLRTPGPRLALTPLDVMFGVKFNPLSEARAADTAAQAQAERRRRARQLQALLDRQIDPETYRLLVGGR